MIRNMRDCCLHPTEITVAALNLSQQCASSFEICQEITRLLLPHRGCTSFIKQRKERGFMLHHEGTIGRI